MSEKCALCGRPPWEGIGQFTATIAAAEERGRLAAAVVCKCGDELQPNDGAICGACLQPEIAEAEERGRRRGVEERDELRTRINNAQIALSAPELWSVRVANALGALAPRVPHASEGPPCAGCGHPKWQHQYGSKEHAFCSQPLDELRREYCRCANYLAPRDSGKGDAAFAEADALLAKDRK